MTQPFDVHIDAVLFDMDGTLVDSTAVVEAMWTDFAVVHGLDTSVLIPASHGRQTIDTVREFLPHLDPAVHDGLATTFTDEEVLRLDGIVEVPGATALVRALVDLPAPVAVVTSATDELARARMRAAGVPILDVLVTPDQHPLGKPAPDGYLLAAERLGVPIGRCLVFEDAEAGVAAGLASGARVVVVGRHESSSTVGLDRVPDLTGITVSRDSAGIRLRR